MCTMVGKFVGFVKTITDNRSYGITIIIDNTCQEFTFTVFKNIIPEGNGHGTYNCS